MSKERYEFRGKIGQGGVGSVYRAFDTQLNREVAIKRVLADGEHEGQEEATKNLLKEASALSSIQHPHIVTIYDVGTDEDGPYVVMELINGRTLDELVEENTLTWEDLREIIVQSQEALAAAQNLDLIHRDLKPSNLMISWLPSGKFQVKIVDFGLAKFSSSPSLQTIEHGDSVFGSIFFMAPEQFERTPLDQRTDMYALGCLYYYALTGMHPFDGESPAEVMVSHLQHHVTPLAELRPDIPQWATDWIMWHIERQMDQRPVNCREAMDQFFAMENQAQTTNESAGSVPTAKIITNTPTVVPVSTTPTSPQAAPTVKMAIPAPTVPMNAPSEPTVSPTIPALKPNQPDPGATTAGKIKAQPTTLPLAAEGEGDTKAKESALGMESAKKTMSNGAKWALISMLIAVIVVTGILGNAYMKQRKLDNMYNEVIKEAKLLTDEETDGRSSLERDGINLTEQELRRILQEATSMAENKQKALILMTLRFAKPEGSYDIDKIILNHTIKAKCPSSIRSGLLKDVVAGRTNPDHLSVLIDFAKTSSEMDSAAAAIRAVRSCSGEPQADDYINDLLDMVKTSESSDLRREAESTLGSILAKSSKKSAHEQQIYESFKKAEDDNIKFAMLRLLGATGGDFTMDAIDDAINSSSASLQNAALTALGNMSGPKKLPILMDFWKNPKNKNMRREAFKVIDAHLREDREWAPGELENVWRELIQTADSDTDKSFIIGSLANQGENWAITLLTPFTQGQSDRIIDYAGRAIENVKKAIKNKETKQDDNSDEDAADSN